MKKRKILGDLMLKSLSTLFCNLILLVITTNAFAEITRYEASTDIRFQPTLKIDLESWLLDKNGKPTYQLKKILGFGFDGVVFLVQDSKLNSFALRLPRIQFSGGFNENYEKQQRVYQLGHEFSDLFLKPVELVNLDSASKNEVTTGVLLPLAESPFENKELNFQEREQLVHSALKSILPRYLKFSSKGYLFNDLALRNFVQFKGDFYLIDLERVSALESSYHKIGDLNIASPEFFLQDKLHSTSDMFSLAVSISKFLFKEEVDFRFYHLGRNPFTAAIMASEFAGYFQRDHYQKAYEQNLFEQNKAMLLEKVKTNIKSEVIYNFLNAALEVDPKKRAIHLQSFTNKHSIKSSVYFCRSLF